MWWLALALALSGLVLAYCWPVMLRLDAAVGTGARAELVVSSWVGRISLAFGWSRGKAVVSLALHLFYLLPLRATLTGGARRGTLREVSSPAFHPWDETETDASGPTGPFAPAGARSPGGGSGLTLGAAARAAGSRLLRRLRVEEVALTARLGLGDAAATAVAAGWLWAALSGGVGWLARQATLLKTPRVQVLPAFAEQPGFSGNLRLRGHVLQGDVLVALASGTWAYLRAVRQREREGVP